jgi:hypothetical protein
VSTREKGKTPRIQGSRTMTHRLVMWLLVVVVIVVDVDDVDDVDGSKVCSVQCK